VGLAEASRRRVFICEPDAEIRALLAHVVRRLGHEPVLGEGGTVDPDEVDILLIDPAFPVALTVAQVVRLAREDVPIVCVSIYPPSDGIRRLRPVAYLLKPFALGELERAIHKAVFATGSDYY
jgi:two-component SAPR family response regulator